MNPYLLVDSRAAKSVFLFLLRLLKPDLVMDIGSRDGREALRFRALMPGARVVAIEANPMLHAAMASDPRFGAMKVELVHAAASNRAGQAIFTVFNARKGTGSLRRKINRQIYDQYEVDMQRPDALVGDARRIALWIDVEGATYEVLEGCSGAMSRVALVHAEVESTEIFEGQRTRDAIEARMRSNGFVIIDENIPVGRHAGNIVFLRRDFALSPMISIPLMAYKIYARLWIVPRSARQRVTKPG